MSWVDRRNPALLGPFDRVEVQPYREPPRDPTPTRVRVLRPILLFGERLEAGTVTTLPRWTAHDLVRSTSAAELADGEAA